MVLLIAEKSLEIRMFAGSEYVENKPSVGSLTQLLLFEESFPLSHQKLLWLDYSSYQPVGFDCTAIVGL